MVEHLEFRTKIDPSCQLGEVNFFLSLLPRVLTGAMYYMVLYS